MLGNKRINNLLLLHFIHKISAIFHIRWIRSQKILDCIDISTLFPLFT